MPDARPALMVDDRPDHLGHCRVGCHDLLRREDTGRCGQFGSRGGGHCRWSELGRPTTMMLRRRPALAESGCRFAGRTSLDRPIRLRSGVLDGLPGTRWRPEEELWTGPESP